MNTILQDIAQDAVVALLIVASAAYAIWALGPRSVRPALARFVERATHGRLPASRLVKTASGCGSCDTCPAPKATAPVVRLVSKK